MSGGVSNVANSLLADILRVAIKRGLLKQEDFEKSTENEIVEKLENSTDESIQKVWQTNLLIVYLRALKNLIMKVTM